MFDAARPGSHRSATDPAGRARGRRPLAFVFVLAGLAATLGGCARLGDLGRGPGTVLAADGRLLPVGDPAGPGSHEVVARGLTIGKWGETFPVALYRPRDQRGPLPAVVFLPGRVAPERLYESYARALASHGFVVAVRGWYGPLLTDGELARDAAWIADWLIGRGLADPARLGVAGHSMGGKDAVLAATESDRFHAVVALDPDDNGRHSVVRGPLANLRAPLLLLGAEVAWKASHVCAPVESNYQRFFERAPPGTIEVTLRGADHVQLLDEPDGFGMSICRCGTADSRRVRTRARRATVAFFTRVLDGAAEIPLAADEGATVRIKPELVARATR